MLTLRCLQTWVTAADSHFNVYASKRGAETLTVFTLSILMTHGSAEATVPDCNFDTPLASAEAFLLAWTHKTLERKLPWLDNQL